MAIRPDALPEWASQDQTDPLTGAENKKEPTPEFKLSGVKRREPLSRAFLNYQLNNIYDWIVYLDERVTDLETP